MDSGREHLQCGNCRHWIKVAGNPANLGAPAQGKCCAMPPSVSAVAVQTQGLGGMRQQGFQLISAYPQLEATFQACSLHEYRRDWETEEETVERPEIGGAIELVGK